MLCLWGLLSFHLSIKKLIIMLPQLKAVKYLHRAGGACRASDVFVKQSKAFLKSYIIYFSVEKIKVYLCNFYTISITNTIMFYLNPKTIENRLFIDPLKIFILLIFKNILLTLSILIIKVRIIRVQHRPKLILRSIKFF